MTSALEQIADWRAKRARAGRMLVALDFDGTLSPIVAHYADAELLPEARRALERLSARPDTSVAVISGRALDDVRARVGIPSLLYAGNHGMEIDGPGITLERDDAHAAREALIAARDDVRTRFPTSTGVICEDKQLTIAVHYRLAPGRRVDVEDYVAAIAAREPRIRMTRGDHVVELRPAIPWDKGSAMLHLVETFDLVGAPVVYIGDDVTDEDAFYALAERGHGVIVSPQPPEGTYATSCIRSVEEVVAVLNALSA